MTSDNTPFHVEYPDIAGYPDGMGFLDEGTSAARDDVLRAAAAQLGLPRTERDVEIAVHEMPGEHLYAATVDGHRIGWLGYELAEGRRVLDHTYVDPAFRGRGIASAIIAHALDELRERDLTITVVCPAVAAFLGSNPSYRDLVDPAHPGPRGA